MTKEVTSGTPPESDVHAPPDGTTDDAVPDQTPTPTAADQALPHQDAPDPHPHPHGDTDADQDPPHQDPHAHADTAALDKLSAEHVGLQFHLAYIDTPGNVLDILEAVLGEHDQDGGDPHDAAGDIDVNDDGSDRAGGAEHPARLYRVGNRPAHRSRVRVAGTRRVRDVGGPTPQRWTQRTRTLSGYFYLVEALRHYAAEIDPNGTLSTVKRHQAALRVLTQDMSRLVAIPMFTVELPDD